MKKYITPNGTQIFDASGIKPLEAIHAEFGEVAEIEIVNINPTEAEIAQANAISELKKIDAEFGPRYIREYFIANNLLTDLTAKGKLEAAETLASSKRQEIQTLKTKG